MKRILLVHPPVSKPGEPPAGLARLAGALKTRGAQFRVIDANMEGLRFLLDNPAVPTDTWTRRACRHLYDNLAVLQKRETYQNRGRYIQAVTELNRVLAHRSVPHRSSVSLNNFTHDELSPVKSGDLLRSAQAPQDNVFYPYFRSRLAEALGEYAPDVVGFSLTFLSQALITLAMVGFLKKQAPGVRIVLGGGLVTSWARGPGWRNPFSGLVDDLVAGPGEGALLSLAGLEDTAGHCLPDYEPFRDYPYLSPRPVLPYSASSGCYWGKCSFCPEQAEANPYLGLPTGQAARDMEELARAEPSGLIHICDNAMSPSLLRGLARGKPRIPWYGFARISRALADPGFCSALRRSGCAMLKLGIESGDQRVLDELGKGIRLHESAQVLKAMKSAGIATYVYLLFGTPPEDEAAAKKTLEFIGHNRDYVDFLNLSIFNLPKGSPEAAGLDTYDFSQGDLSLYQGFVHPRGWDRGRVRRFLDKEFRRAPAIARILRRDPPSFTSNHAPFFTSGVW